MDYSADGNDPLDFSSLSYDETVAYEEQVPTHPSNDPERGSLVNRIGSTKIYLLSESSMARVGKFVGDLGHGKRKHNGDEQGVQDDVEMDEGMHLSDNLSYRPNALLFHGSPISQLTTGRIFAYATHFETDLLGVEWVDDTTCVLVFRSKTAARLAYRHLQKSAAEGLDDGGFITAKPIPVAIWPPEERINKSLGKGEGLKGTIRMRWARGEDVKKKGAKKESEFYRKHGAYAGKELHSERGDGPQKRRRRDAEEDEMQQKAQLDDELDEFLAEEDEVVSPPSKMRSDYIASDGKTLLERTSDIRVHGHLSSRMIAPLPRSRGRNGRRMKSQRELDDELDSFLNDRVE